MNVKIQGGGGGTYANTGSCTGVVTYLQHEDLERIRQGQQAEPFFNQYRDFVSPKEVTYKIDHNRAQLHKTDAKFFVITVSPSEKELAAMGASPEEQARAMKEYIHAHIIVSRKDRANKLKLSPKTNHRGTAKGAVRGGFDRTDFFRKCERCFDVRMNYNREIKESFEYLNAIKNGTTAEIRQQAIKAVQHEAAREASKEIGKKVTRKIVKGMGGMGL